jgi:hypothetical protein
MVKIATFTKPENVSHNFMTDEELEIVVTELSRAFGFKKTAFKTLTEIFLEQTHDENRLRQ